MSGVSFSELQAHFGPRRPWLPRASQTTEHVRLAVQIDGLVANVALLASGAPRFDPDFAARRYGIDLARCARALQRGAKHGAAA